MDDWMKVHAHYICISQFWNYINIKIILNLHLFCEKFGNLEYAEIMESNIADINQSLFDC